MQHAAMILGLLTLAAGTPASSAAPPVRAGDPAATVLSQEKPRTILFIGNSFTHGAHSAVRNWRAEKVSDLNGSGYGGVPALFKTFAEQSGLNYVVSLQTQGGKTLGFHYDERRRLVDRSWDVVVLQEHSTLSRQKPGDASDYERDVARFSALFTSRNPAVQIHLMPTWTRADLTYRGNGRWYGKPVTAMAGDLQTAAEKVVATTRGISGILPVGRAWNRAFLTGVADANPYDGIAFNQLNLWSYDHYHGSIAGYYLQALVVFGAVTGVDPVSLGGTDVAADQLGLSKEQARSLQKVASDELAAIGTSTR